VAYKGGKVVRVGAGGALEVAKYEKKDKDRDELDLWSRERGRELAKMNEKLSRRHANALLSSASLSMFPSRFSANGVWYYSSLSGCYTFLPFGGYHWSSPYGHGYGNQLFIPYTNAYGRCYGCNNTGYGTGVVRNGGGVSNPGSNSSSTPGVTPGPRPALPGSVNAGGPSREPVVTGSSSQPMMIIPGRGKDN
jgi:hypothetical protein